MKVEWYWLVVAAVVAWYWSRQREQNLVAQNAAATYAAQHPLDVAATAPPGVNVAKLMKASWAIVAPPVPAGSATIIA